MLWDGERWTGLTRPRRADPDLSGEPVGAPAAEGTRAGGRAERRRPRKLVVVAIVAAVVLLLGGGGTAVAVVHAQQTAAEARAKEKREAAARLRAEEREAARNAQEASDEAERSSRRATVTEVEASVKKMAEEDVTKGIIDGPIMSVSCNPVSGSTDDLTDTTTTFDCFAANKDNEDGTQSGYFFNSTVNWSSGQYTYGLGKSGS
jgi:cytoskeletal protein RodZ